MPSITQNANVLQPSNQNQTDDSGKSWRHLAANALWYAGHEYEAEAFYYCGDDTRFSAFVRCSANPDHYEKPLPHTCHRRYCPDCEKRANAKRFQKYMPKIEEVCNFGRKDFSLKHIILTTPYCLEDDNIEEMERKAWKHLNQTIERVMFLVAKDNPRIKLTKAEKRRGRVSLRKQGMGCLVGLEFGEEGFKLHFHILFYGPYIPQEMIVDQWKKYTGGVCQIVHIKKVETHTGAREVLLKYATKLTELPPRLIPKLRDVLHGTRRIRAYGIFYGLPPVPEEDHYHACPECDAPVEVVFCSVLHAQHEVLTRNSGNKSGEKKGENNQRPPPKPPPKPLRQPAIPGIWEQVPEKRTFTYE